MSAIALYASQVSKDYPDKLAETLALLRHASERYPGLAQASSLGAEDMVLTHLLHQIGSPADIFVLDTGMLHPETRLLVAQIEARYQRAVTLFRPDPTALADFVAEHGEQPMYRSLELRLACCRIRKVEPLARALAGRPAWITGLRREQSGARAELSLTDQSDPAQLKLNPLANWSWGDVWHTIALHEIAYNPLHDQFFPSIGCAPCTRAVAVGEDFRAGRWWWEQDNAKECGLHVQAAASPLPGAAHV